MGLLFIECNRPGRILPGACGILLVLLAAAHLLHMGLNPWAAASLLGCAAILLLNVWRALPPWLLVLITLGGIFGAAHLIRPTQAQRVTWPVAIACAGLIGVLSAVLTRIAYRARRAKALD